MALFTSPLFWGSILLTFLCCSPILVLQGSDVPE
nr:MAG TPA: hypothetical protein [Caudoviricetes sp.]